MMSKIVRTMAGIIIPFVFVFALVTIVHGHLTPGGGFQGGAVFASGVALFVVAYGARYVHKSVKEKHLSILESTGALVFIGLGFAGLGTVFFYNFLVGSSVFGNIPPTGSNPGDIWTSGIVFFMNAGVGLKVIAGLSTVLIVMGLITGMTEVEE